jgi:hypothetical protein
MTWRSRLHQYIRPSVSIRCSGPDGDPPAGPSIAQRPLEAGGVIRLCQRRSDLCAITAIILAISDGHLVRLKTRLRYAARRYSWPRASIAQMMRACLAASATAAILFPRRCFSCSAQRLLASVRLPVSWSTLRVPWINSVRRYTFLRLLMWPRRVLPPLEYCWGTSPSHAANCRPFLNAFPSPIAATIAVAVVAPHTFELHHTLRRLTLASKPCDPAVVGGNPLVQVSEPFL